MNQPAVNQHNTAPESRAERIHRRLQHLADRLVGQLSPQSKLFAVAAIVGVITGICAGLLKLAINAMASLFVEHIHDGRLNWFLLGLPAIGFLLTLLFQRKIIRLPLTHGTDLISADLKKGKFDLPRRLTYAWMAGGTLTLGFGGSAGSEGPIASTGAALGSNIGRLCRMTPPMVRILLGCGAGAGIAAIFKAPIGGFLFTLEVLKLELGTLSVMTLLLSCVVASLVAYAMSGFTVDLGFIQTAQFEPEAIPWILALGVVCGFYSLYYSGVMAGMGRVYSRVGSPWLRSLVCGLLLGVLLFVFPALYGEGYGTMQRLLNGDTHALFAYGFFTDITPTGWELAAMCLAVALMKSFACSATTDGGVAGDFAPTLYAGCIVGLLFATVANTGLHAGIPAGSFAFLGMAGVMAGVIRAPFMAIFLTAEMCNSYLLLLPLAVVAVTSIGVVRIFRPATPYRT